MKFPQKSQCNLIGVELNFMNLANGWDFKILWRFCGKVETKIKLCANLDALATSQMSSNVWLSTNQQNVIQRILANFRINTSKINATVLRLL